MTRRKIRLGGVMLCLGLIGLFVAFGPGRFIDRFSGRVDVVGTVQWGISIDAQGPDDLIDDGEHGVWKVDYEIDGSAHTGVIIGAYEAGEQINVSAPSDGSFYSRLREASSLPMKILSVILMPLGLVATIAGGWMLVAGIRARDSATRAEAHAQLAARYPQLFARPEASAPGVPSAPHPPPPPASSAQIPPPPGEQRPAHKPDFYAPYDL